MDFGEAVDIHGLVHGSPEPLALLSCYIIRSVHGHPWEGVGIHGMAWAGVRSRHPSLDGQASLNKWWIRLQDSSSGRSGPYQYWKPWTCHERFNFFLISILGEAIRFLRGGVLTATAARSVSSQWWKGTSDSVEYVTMTASEDEWNWGVGMMKWTDLWCTHTQRWKGQTRWTGAIEPILWALFSESCR